MEYNILIIGILISLFIWVAMHIKDRRRVLNGLWFIISLGLLWVLLMVYSITRDIQWLSIIISIGLIFAVFMASIAYLGFIISLFITGKKVIEKEGFSLSHALGLLFGIGIIISSLITPLLKKLEDYKILTSIIIFGNTYFIYFMIGFFIYSSSALVYRFYKEKKNKDFFIVLGAGLNGDRVTPLLASRIDKAIEFYEKQKMKNKKIPKIIMSGGQGADELISEAEAMKNYALEQGIPEEDIICEDKSTSTKENIIFSKNIIERQGIKSPKVLFFTNNYHVFRAALLSKDLGTDYNGIGSKTKLYFFIPAFIREYIAVLYMKIGLHLKISTIIGIINILVLNFK